MQETRLTHLGIHILVLVTLFAMQALKTIPMSVLYGVFLFMGELFIDHAWCTAAPCTFH